MTIDLERVLREHGALLEGHFRLSSGRHSDRFVQKFRILEDPGIVSQVAQPLAESFCDVKPTVVVSAAVGGIILGYEVARVLGVKAIFIEKEQGAPVLRRGFQLRATDRVLVVEDVITTGASVEEVIAVVRSTGAAVVGVAVIVQRAPVAFTVPAVALLEMPIESFAADECPMCRAGIAIVDPGSRRA